MIIIIIGWMNPGILYPTRIVNRTTENITTFYLFIVYNINNIDVTYGVQNFETSYNLLHTRF